MGTERMVWRRPYRSLRRRYEVMEMLGWRGSRFCISIFLSPFSALRSISRVVWVRINPAGFLSLRDQCVRSTRSSLISSTMSPKAAPYGTWHSPITSDAIVENVSRAVQPYLITTNSRLRRSESHRSLSIPSHPPSTTSKPVPAKAVDA